jgi:hypothetical protein
MTPERGDRPDESEANERPVDGSTTKGTAGEVDGTAEQVTASEDTVSEARTRAGEPGGEQGGAQGRQPEQEGGRERDQGRRDVIVSRELYKVVTVFSTLIAIVAVVGGFVLLDTATNRTLAAASEVNLPLAIGGVGLIALGAATYAFASRFRTREMGSHNSDAGE